MGVPLRFGTLLTGAHPPTNPPPLPLSCINLHVPRVASLFVAILYLAQVLQIHLRPFQSSHDSSSLSLMSDRGVRMVGEERPASLCPQAALLVVVVTTRSAMIM